MRRLKAKSKPKSLTLQEVYDLYRMDTGTETPDFIIKVLDLCYPKLNRENNNVLDRMNKYREALANYTVFYQMVEGMVGNGIK